MKLLDIIRSPIKSAEEHYKEKYHLKYRNAKKLFVFDIGLLLLTLAIAGLGIFWWTYNPTIADLVLLSITPSKDRVASGEAVEYTVRYHNKTGVPLPKAELVLDMPPGFVSEGKTTFPLDTISPNGKGEATIEGILYGTPNENYPLKATLSYDHEARSLREFSSIHLIVTPRDSVLKTEATLPDTFLSHGSFPVEITVRNDGAETLKDVRMPVNPAPGITLAVDHYPDGLVGDVEPKQRITMKGTVATQLDDAVETLSLSLAPSITIHGKQFSQGGMPKAIRIIHPLIVLETSWNDSHDSAAPGDVRVLTIHATNRGTTELTNLALAIPVPDAIIDTSRLKELNHGIFKNGMWVIDQKVNKTLTELNRGDSYTIELSLPIRYTPQGGTDLLMTVSPTMSAEIPGFDGGRYETTNTSPPMKIGTGITLNASMRYYTEDGDQIGRGPLPPRVGEETRYFALVNIHNNTSEVDQLGFSATIPSGIRWTGKTSVSRGKDLNFNPATREVTWDIPTLAAHDTAGLYFELGMTPTVSEIGTTPILLKNIHVSGTDNYIHAPVSADIPAINASLSKDAQAQERGVVVTE